MVIDVATKFSKTTNSENSILVIENFLEKKKKEGKSKSLIRNYRYDILDFYQNTGIDDIENIVIEDVEDYVETLRGRNCSGSTINRRISAIKSMIKYFIKLKRS